MSQTPVRAIALLFAALPALLLSEEYKFGPDSERQPNVPTGSVTHYTWAASKLYPGTTRDYWVYAPAQYKGDKPAAVMIFQDGGGFIKDDGAWRAPLVMDNLIAKGSMPVTIGIFINPGVMPATSANAQGRYNRSYEYDALGDRYARFLIEEILPEVGKQYKLSNDPNDYGLVGSSSGASAAFTAAWSRPDVFRRVVSFVGSYTNLRGADIYPNLIRKVEPKPLRVFLQDGQNDQSIYAGSWFHANQDMYAALKYSGYDVTFTIGTEGHNAKHGGTILPDALRWVWRDYPQPVGPVPAKAERHTIKEILEPASEWELVGEGYGFTEGPAVDKQGQVFFTDVRNSRIHKIGLDGKVTVWKEDTGNANGLMFGADGRLYVCQNGRKRIVAYAPDGTEAVLAEGVNSNDIAVSAKGDIYFTEPPTKRVWHIDAKGNKKVAFEGLAFPNGVRFSADQSLLLVADMNTRFVWSFQVQTDGSLINGQPFYHLEIPDGADLGPIRSGADGMTVDTEGHLYVATALGVQICDQAGRVVGIINKPHAGPLSNVVFGGPDLQTLYVTAGDKVFKRKLRRKGTVSWNPVKPPQPRL